MSQQTIALHKPQVDPDSGAPVTFFVIAQYTIRTLNGPGSQAVLQGYVSQSAFGQGKRALSHIAVDLPAQPEGDTLQWLYGQIPAVDGDLQAAVPVYAAEDASEPA